MKHMGRIPKRPNKLKTGFNNLVNTRGAERNPKYTVRNCHGLNFNIIVFEPHLLGKSQNPAANRSGKQSRQSAG